MQPSTPQVAREAGKRAQAVGLLGSRWWRECMLMLLLVVGLLALDTLCYAVALPVSVTYSGSQGTLHVGTQTIPLGKMQRPTELVLVPRDPVVHEYQLDGTDSTNNFTLDTIYLDQIANTPYYRFQAWMRDLDGTSVWRGVRVAQGGQLASALPQAVNGASLALPFTGDFTASLQLQRPETPAVFSLVLANGDALNVTLDRNDHVIRVVSITGPGQAGQQVRSFFFPRDPLPFAAMVVDFLTRTALWAALLVIAAFLAQLGLVVAWAAWERYFEPFLARTLTVEGMPIPSGIDGEDAAQPALATPNPAPNLPGAHALTATALPEADTAVSLTGSTAGSAAAAGLPEGEDVHDASAYRARGTTDALVAGARARLRVVWARLTVAIHPVGVAALGCAFVLYCWIALAQYNALPHIYDATAYLFGAKIYALGRLSVPVPAAVKYFPGPFMVTHAGQWFTQYAPGTSAMLALGLRLGVVWLVEPVLGALALLGIGLIAARLFTRRVATIAVLLGALSPFFGYIAASYLSHAVALCFLVWGFWAFLRFAQGEAAWNLPLAAACFGMAGLTRDLIAVLFAGVVVLGVLALSLPRWRGDPRAEVRRWLWPAFGFLAVALCFFGLYFAFDARLTGNPFVTPRLLFNPTDRWGFGQGIGFYGAHTLAAGFVTVDELLAALAIDLFGWPFYLTLAFLVVPFALRRARPGDVFLLLGAAVMTFAFIGYYYHGIYLGPRYLTEALPFYLILSARGIVTLGEATVGVGRRALVAQRSRAGYEDLAAPPRWARSFGLGLVVTLLLACSILYFWPRQLVLHDNFTGMAVGTQIDFTALDHPPFHNAIVVTGDYQLYGYTLFALNDPLLRGDVLYAFASTQDDYAALRQDFPTRTIYVVHVALNGQVSYSQVAG